jgi:hypothetical protein
MTDKTDQMDRLQSKRFALRRLEKEHKELSRTMADLRGLASKGDPSSVANLALVTRGYDECQRRMSKMRGDIAELEGRLGSVWLRRDQEET